MTPTPAEMRALVRRHIALWKHGSHAEWRACFSDDYVIEDPVGTGLRPMGSYADEWQNMHGDLRLDMEAYRLIVGGREVLADLRAVTHLGPGASGPDAVDGARSTLSYTGIYTVGDPAVGGGALLVANRTFADPVPEALWKAFYPTLPSPAEREPPARSADQLRQGIEDELYFWNVGSYEAWRRRFAEDALIEDPVGSGLRPLGSGRERWAAGHADGAPIRRGAHRVIVCEMEAMVHAVEARERDKGVESAATAEVFAFDAAGRIRSWRVFRER